MLHSCEQHHRVPTTEFEGDECYGELWECERCKRTICAGFGASDSFPEVCDDCYYILNPAATETDCV